MKNGKSILALMLALLLCLTLLAACGAESEPQNNAGQTGSTNDAADKAPATDDGGAAEPDGEQTDPILARLGDDWEYEVETLVFYILDDSGNNESNEEHVEAALNEYLEPYGIAIDLRFGGYGTYPTYVANEIYAGNAVDLAQCYPGRDGNFLNWYTEKMILPITGLLEQYAPETLELMAPYMGSMTYGGEIYGVPGLRALASSPYLIMREDVLDELGLEEEARALNSFSDLEALYEKVMEQYDYMYAVGGGTYTAANVFYGGNDSWDDATALDIPDTLGIVFVQDDVAQLLYTSDYYLEDVKMAASWMEKGYIYPDAIHTESLPDELITSGAQFSYFTASEIGIEATKEANLGVELVCVQVADGMIGGGSLRRFGVTIPSTCEYPEKAALMINFLYTDPHVINLIAWGVEGTDYAVNGEGEACFPENGATYHNRDYLLGNQFLCLPWEGQGGDFRSEAEAINAQSPVSQYITFSFDSAGLDNMVANLSSVIDQYENELRGGYYTDEMYGEFMAKLEVAGVDQWVEEVQKQIDAWVAAN